MLFSLQAAPQVFGNTGLMGPMSEITNGQDTEQRPSSSVRQAVAARLAKAGSASAAMSGEKPVGLFSYTE